MSQIKSQKAEGKSKKRGKQHDARAASFARIAKELRTRSANLKATWRKTRLDDFQSGRLEIIYETLLHVADTFAAEAKLLRRMR